MKKIVLGIVAFMVGVLLLVISMNFTAVFASQQEKLNICHKTHSETNPWVAQQINANELQSHLDNGDFLYNGPLKTNGHPENANHQGNLWCVNHSPEVLLPPPPSNPPPPPAFHTACIENSCVFVEGAGENGCAIEQECQTLTPPPPPPAVVPPEVVTPPPPPEEHQDFVVTTPVCTNGDTAKAAGNIHVIRSGKDATVNFFITQGDSANIYYKVVGHDGWQFSVADVKPNSNNFVSVTIHDLNPNLGYTFGVQQKTNCGGGLITGVVVDGPQSQTFRVNYWEQ